MQFPVTQLWHITTEVKTYNYFVEQNRNKTNWEASKITIQPVVDQVYRQRNIRNSSHADMTPYILTCNPSITLTSEVLAFQQTHVMKVINNKAGQKITVRLGFNIAFLYQFSCISSFSAFLFLLPSDVSLWVCVDVTVVWWKAWKPVSPVTAASTAVHISEMRKKTQT